MKEKRFLIVTASIGAGHVKAAEAISDELKIKYPDAKIETVDFSKWSISWATAFMKACYLCMLRFIPNLYDVMYRFTGGKAGGLSMQSLISALTARDVRALVRRYQPDVILCTHPFPAGAAAWRKKRHPGEYLFSTVITDYSVHQMWIYPNVESYFVASENMKTDLIAAGLPSAQVHVTGIPVTAQFRRHVNREVVIEELSLQESVPVVLIMGGGLGLGEVDGTLREIEGIEQTLQILVVAGKNAALKTRAEAFAARSHHRVQVWGFTNKVREFMEVASFIISKPGALTISEALAAELPMVLHDPIPGPETQNAVCMARQGAAVWVNKTSKLGSVLTELLENPDLLPSMRASAHTLKKPYAAQEIAELLAKQLEILRNRQKIQQFLTKKL